jgi:hypothetical protein
MVGTDKNVGYMKYWEIGYSEATHGLKGLKLLTDEKEDRILSIVKLENGCIKFTEECDGYFALEVSKEDAIKLLNDAIDWIQK